MSSVNERINIIRSRLEDARSSETKSDAGSVKEQFEDMIESILDYIEKGEGSFD